MSVSSKRSSTPSAREPTAKPVSVGDMRVGEWIDLDSRDLRTSSAVMLAAGALLPLLPGHPASNARCGA